MTAKVTTPRMDATDTYPNKKRCAGKEGKDRVRVTRACDICKRKKLRCSGTLPCSLCLRLNRDCQYTAGYTRGRLPSIPQLNQDGTVSVKSNPGSDDNPIPSTEGSLEPLQRHTASVPPSNASESSVQINGQTPRVDETIVAINQDEMAPIPSSRNSPEPAQTDMEGHYVGPSSGVSFLLRAQKRLHENVKLSPNTSIFNFGDSPLPKYDTCYFVLPTKDEAKTLVRRYFDFAFPTHRFLHQPTVEGWLEEFYNNLNPRREPARGEREVKALLLMVMVQAKQHLPDSDVASCVDSAVYFGASEQLLAAETGPVRLTSIQARLAQCFYLLSESRVNHSWSLFGTTSRLAIAIGLHRRRRRETSAGMDIVEQECRKRVFWSAYSLDNYLSAALGRPRILHDDDIDQELPACSNDAEITRDRILPPVSNGQSVMLASVFHAKLARIFSGILKDLYGIRRTSLEAQISIAKSYDYELTEWRRGISCLLDLPNVDLLVVVYQRQYTVLNLAFSHAQILLHRPFLLRNFASLARSSGSHDESLQNVQKCLQAASKIVSIIREMCENGRMYSTYFFTHYYTFSAIVVLYVYVIQRVSSPPEVWKAYFEAGQQAQQDLTNSGTTTTFSHRYVMVLEELRKEALRLIQRNSGYQPNDVQMMPPPNGMDGRNNNMNNMENPSLQQVNGMAKALEVAALESKLGAINGTNGVQDTGDFMEHTSPSSLLADLTGWGEFDSLAVAGLGELEHLFPVDGVSLQPVPQQAWGHPSTMNNWNFGG